VSSGVVVIGAGGHAKVVIELLRASGHPIACCVGTARDPSTCLGVPVRFGDEHLRILRDEGCTEAFVALGANRVRMRLGALALGLGYRLVNAVSPNAVVSTTARLGVGIAIMPGVVINAEASIGDLAIVNTGATVDHDCIVGRGAHVGPQCGLAGNVTVGDGALLGIGCKVIPGITIAPSMTVGAGSVVVRDLVDGELARGVPARTIR